MSRSTIEKLFREYDTDNSGFIDVAQVRSYLESTYKDLGLEVSNADVEDFIKNFDTSKDGKISLEEFVTNFESVTGEAIKE